MKNLKFLRSSFFVPLLISITFFVFVSINIQGPSIKGIADNGDFGRIMYWTGIEHQTHGAGIKHLDWVERFYSIETTPIESRSFSSGLIFVFIAKGINVLIHPKIFDIRILGIVHSLFYSTAIYIALFYLKKVNKFIFWIAIPFVFIILGDISYISYFNSFFEEASGMIFLIFLVAGLIKTIYDLRINNRSDILKDFAIVALLSIFLISAKPQYFVLFIPIAFTIYLLFKNIIRKSNIMKVISVISIFAVVYYLLGTPDIIKRWNIYNTVFAQILGNAENVGRASKIIGINDIHIKYAGIPGYGDGSGVYDIGIQKHLTVKTFIYTFKYYLLSPKEVYNLSKSLSLKSFNTIIPFLGYFEQNVGNYANQKPHDNVFWSSFKSNYLFRLSNILFPAIVLNLLMLIVLYIRKKANYYVLGSFISLSALLQFLIVMFTEGVYGVTEKQLLLYNILFDILLFYWIIYFLTVLINLFLETVERTRKVQLDFNLEENAMFYVGDKSSRKLYENTIWEPDVLAYIDRYAKGDVLEIGSHIGIHSINIAKKIGLRNNVYAFEPSPKSFKLLKKNCSKYQNIIPINLAVNDGSTNKVSLHHYFGYSAWDNISREGRFIKNDRPFMRKIFSKTTVVNSISLDEFISKNNEIRPGFIKIDAENSEMSIIKGAKKTLLRSFPAIVFEGGDLGRVKGEKTGDMISLLVGMGYKIYGYDYKTQSIKLHKIRNKYVETINLLAVPRRLK